MSATISGSASLCWCQVPVPQELETEVLCVQHFLTTVEHDCSELRREIAVGKTTPPRQAEIAAWSAHAELRTPMDVESRQYFNDLQSKCAPKREDISSWFDLLDADDYVSFGGKA